jgi:transposase
MKPEAEPIQLRTEQQALRERLLQQDERLALLEAEHAAKDRQIAHLQEQVATLEAQVRHLLLRLAKDSHNSSKPPSSDGLSRRPRSQRVRSERKPGGQPGHAGQALAQVAVPDVEVLHRPTACDACQCPLDGVAGQVVERRQVQDVPPLKLVVTEHQVEVVRCPQCQHVTRGAFPPEVSAPAQYGPGVRALAVYLNQYQLLPEARTCETLTDLLGCALSDGTVADSRPGERRTVVAHSGADRRSGDGQSGAARR